MIQSLLPLLSEEGNHQLFLQAKSGDNEARDLFFRHNYRLILYTAKWFANTVLSDDDIIGLCQLGFLQAYNKFDPNSGVKFSAYSKICMKNEVLKTLRKYKQLKNEVSIYSPLKIDEEGNIITFYDVLVETPSVGIDDDYTDLGDIIKEFQKNASNTVVQVFRLYYLHGKSQNEIAERIGISKKFVSRLCKRISKELKLIAVQLEAVD